MEGKLTSTDAPAKTTGGCMFTIGDIRNIAVQIEKNGEESYRRASRIATDPKVAQMLNRMAEQESRHARWFSNLRSDKPLTDEQLELEKMGKSLLQDMIKTNDFLVDQDTLEKATTVEEVLNISKQFEEDTVLFYTFLLGFIDDEHTAAQLQEIIAEEQNHISQLEVMEE
jgi:rubrerythrin